jgi:hypothetical protein
VEHKIERKERLYPLGFGIENGVLVFNLSGARPATDQELILWHELRKSHPELTHEPSG